MSRAKKECKIERSRDMTIKFHFSNDIFLLERHESYALERFAYNAARIGAQAFRPSGRSYDVSIVFDEDAGFRARIGAANSVIGEINEFEIHTTPISPIMILGHCSSFGEGLNSASLMRWISDNSAFQCAVEKFRSTFLKCNEEYASLGSLQCIRDCVAALGGHRILTGECPNYFDALSQSIVNHEVAHAYTGQFTARIDSDRGLDARAKEIVADVVATEWMYNLMVRNTPNSEEYRKIRGTNTHAESIISNMFLLVHSQLLALLFQTIVPSLNPRRGFTLDGGGSHPHGFVRHSLQQIVLTTLVLSNQREFVRDSEMASVDTYWRECIRLFLKCGLLDPRETQEAIHRMAESQEIGKAADFMEQHAPQNLRGVVPLLRLFSDQNHLDRIELG